SALTFQVRIDFIERAVMLGRRRKVRGADRVRDTARTREQRRFTGRTATGATTTTTTTTTEAASAATGRRAQPVQRTVELSEQCARVAHTGRIVRPSLQCGLNARLCLIEPSDQLLDRD